MTQTAPTKIPVTVLTGYLGAGDRRGEQDRESEAEGGEFHETDFV